MSAGPFSVLQAKLHRAVDAGIFTAEEADTILSCFEVGAGGATDIALMPTINQLLNEAAS